MEYHINTCNRMELRFKDAKTFSILVLLAQTAEDMVNMVNQFYHQKYSLSDLDQYKVIPFQNDDYHMFQIKPEGLH